MRQLYSTTSYIWQNHRGTRFLQSTLVDTTCLRYVIYEYIRYVVCLKHPRQFYRHFKSRFRRAEEWNSGPLWTWPHTLDLCHRFYSSGRFRTWRRGHMRALGDLVRVVSISDSAVLQASNASGPFMRSVERLTSRS